MYFGNKFIVSVDPMLFTKLADDLLFDLLRISSFSINILCDMVFTFHKAEHCVSHLKFECFLVGILE